MKSAGNRGVVQSRLQVLHVHVFLVAPLSTCHMAQPRADQHQGGVAIGERPHHAGSAADLTVQPLDYVVGADTRACKLCLLLCIFQFAQLIGPVDKVARKSFLC